MDSKIGALAVAVMKNSKEVQAENEKLIALVADQVRQFKALEASMPAIKKEVFDSFYKWAEESKAELTDVAAYNAKAAMESHKRAIGEENAVKVGELTAKINMGLVDARKAMLAEIVKETELSVRKYLSSAEGVEKVRGAVKENAGPLLAAFETSGSAFIDLYRGTFKPGTSKAKRGELWTYFGNTLLCTADTNREPVPTGNTDTLKNWVIVAASGAPGAAASSSGSGSSAWGDITGTLSSQTDLQTVLDALLTVPAQSKSADYTAVLGDAGKSIDHPSTDANARTFTIPANSSVAYAVGTCLSFSNMTSNVVTIAITTDTMYLAGTGTTGSRSLAQYGVATARKLTSTTWLISGTGLT